MKHLCEYCGHDHKPDPFYCIARQGEEIVTLKGDLEVAMKSQHNENCDCLDLQIPDKSCNCYLHYKTANIQQEEEIATLKTRAEEAEGEIRKIDSVLARRSALDDIPFRDHKIAYAIKVAAKADALATDNVLQAQEIKSLREALEKFMQAFIIAVGDKSPFAKQALKIAHGAIKQEEEKDDLSRTS